MRDIAAHGAGVRLDADRVEPHAFEGARVRAVLRGVALLEPGRVRVEAVSVLHDELADAQESRAGTRLIAALGLEVVDDLRHLAIALDLLFGVLMHELLVRVADHELAAVVIGRSEGDRLERFPPPGLLPGLRGRQHRHLHLLRADPVLLLADDLLDLLGDTEPEREPRIEAGCERPRDRGAQQQTVAGRLSFGGCFAQGATKEVRLSHG